MIADYIDEFIMVCAGLWMSGVGFGFFRAPIQGQSGEQAWWARLVTHFKWMGPLLLLIAIALAIAAPS
ncbi:hypothetical protein DUT91_19265 [Phyllobacterium salinisoli]|uniref:Uncharacterized protein n=1 Tax=Phyllobacterium salinisoli TaxID=1899321 RepID=A0A368JZ22_9HYPH|nr:hypothetical protein [Phyllobacterium salinisoli]RCS22144.1 hypothetical protein DUT91_19265 [Phyllobacterium salinisoli]